MTNLVEHILTKNYVAAGVNLKEAFVTIFGRKLQEMRKQVAAKHFYVEECEDEEILDEARIAIVKARIRGGKIQRRKKVSNVVGMTMRGGKLTRMSPTERRKRKMGARKAARKARGKRSQMMRKRKLSLMKRKRLGI